MFHQARVLCLLACVAGWSIAGQAQPVYRCGDNSYSNKPCPGGTPVQVDDPRSAAQRAQTEQAARRDAKAADDMEKARLKQEANAPRANVPAPVAQVPAQAASADRTLTPFRAKKPAYFTAVSPKKPVAKVSKTKKKTTKKAKARAS